MSKTLKEFNAMTKKKSPLNGKIILPEEMVEALRFVTENTEADRSLIIEQALLKFGIVQKAKSLRKELGAEEAKV